MLAILSLAGAIAAVFAVLMVLQRSLYRCAICLLVVLFQVAVFFFFCGAPLLAFLQILIYAGAVMVLVVIVVMAAPSSPADAWSRLSMPRWLAVAAIAVAAGETALMLARSTIPGGSPRAALALQNSIGAVLFGPYAVATEAVTFLMFLAALAVLDSPKEAA